MRNLLPPADTGYAGYSMPQVEFRRRENIGRNLLTSLFRKGEVESIVIGDKNRHVIMSSWRDYVARKLSGTERDPAEKQRAIEAYQASVARSKGARATALARSNWGPDHGKKGGSPHLASPRAAPRRRASPPAAAEAPKKTAGKSRSPRKESAATV
jgi:hypothetical protein